MSERIVNRYTDEEREFILRHYWDGKQREDVCRLLSSRHTMASVHYQYYDLLKKEVKMKPAEYRALMMERLGDKIEEMRESLRNAKRLSDVMRPSLTAVPQPEKEHKLIAVKPQEADVEARIFSMLQATLEQVETALEEVGAKIEAKINARVEQQGKALATIAKLMAQASSGREIPDVDGLITAVRKLEEENESLKAQLAEQKAEYSKIYNALNFWLGEFMSLDQVGKVTSLADFIPRLKVIVERFGTVQGIERKGHPLDFEQLERETQELKRATAVR